LIRLGGRSKIAENDQGGKFELAAGAFPPYRCASGSLRVTDELASLDIRPQATGIQPPHDFSETILIQNSRSRSH